MGFNPFEIEPFDASSNNTLDYKKTDEMQSWQNHKLFYETIKHFEYVKFSNTINDDEQESLNNCCYLNHESISSEEIPSEDKHEHTDMSPNNIKIKSARSRWGRKRLILNPTLNKIK